MKERFGKIALAIAGVVVGVLLLSPVAAHVNDNFSHLWGDHIKPKTDDRYVQLTKSPWARVDADANLIKGEGVIDVTDSGTGNYTIEFARRVGNNCAGTATSWTAGLIANIQELEGKRFVDVDLYNVVSNPVDGEFSVMFRC
jgi:hypothetical protein